MKGMSGEFEGPAGGLVMMTGTKGVLSYLWYVLKLRANRDVEAVRLPDCIGTGVLYA
ncbi:hypothetical protein BV22DRAFT_1041414 [Leucogyrophana mollusca]|uniref:Uncharacterized protein n=1 Tax=Leucogyrophana mollusca TaxID=85980 RepID=A0ACB8B2E5_9AGAM|nr:hypothetical protein BV22DRAFT_1041414 [Leucogyrophana mollusca]